MNDLLYKIIFGCTIHRKNLSTLSGPSSQVLGSGGRRLESGAAALVKKWLGLQ